MGDKKKKDGHLVLKRQCPCGYAVISFDKDHYGTCQACGTSYVLDTERDEVVNAEEYADVYQQMKVLGDGEAFRQLIERGGETPDSADSVRFQREKNNVQDDYSGIVLPE